MFQLGFANQEHFFRVYHEDLPKFFENLCNLFKKHLHNFFLFLECFKIIIC